MRIRREEHMAGGNGNVIIKEILDAKHISMVGNSHTRHSISMGFLQQVLDLALSIEETEFCMYV